MKEELLVQRQEAKRQQEQFQTQLQAMQSTIFQLSQGFNTLSQIVAATSGTPSNGSNGSSTPASSAPVTPSDSSPAAPAAPVTSPSSAPASLKSPLPEITPAKPFKKHLDLSKIVTADL